MATRLIDGGSARSFQPGPSEPIRCLAQRFFAHLIGDLARRSEQHHAAIRDLRSQDDPHGGQRAIRAIGHPILLTPQQYIT